MHQEFDAHGLPRKRRHVHRLVDPRLGIKALMEDRLQDVAIGIRDIGVLPVELDGVGSTIPVPEAQRASARRYRELLVERAIAYSLEILEAAEAIRCVAHESGECSAVRLHVGYSRRSVLI
jgi:hypothetical protein